MKSFPFFELPSLFRFDGPDINQSGVLNEDRSNQLCFMNVTSHAHAHAHVHANARLVQ
jgi:hypothetical protein